MPMSKVVSQYNNGDYLSKNLNWHQEDSPYKSKLVMQMLSKNNIKFKSCADVGCGAGLVAEILADNHKDKDFFGYDLSKDAQRFWADKKKIKNLLLKNEDILVNSNLYDLIICMDVFEHIPNYYQFLLDLNSRSKFFIFNIPLDMSVIKLITPGIKLAREKVGHIHYFNKYTALKTLEDCEYKILDYKLCAPFKSNKPRNNLQLLMLPFRFLSLIFGDQISSTLFGGYSLMVLAKTN